MGRAPVVVSVSLARRLAVTKQRLAGPLPRGTAREAAIEVVRDLGYVQWDPVPIVAPSHLLSFWARCPRFRPSDLERLLFDEKRLFEHWTPAASLVLTEDYPLYRSLMERYPVSMSSSWGAQRDRARRFLAGHVELRRRLLRELEDGPRTLGGFREHATTRRSEGDWSPASDVAEMLYHLGMTGEVMVVGHEGSQNLWGLSDRFLPPGTDRAALSEPEFERRAAVRAIRALGTATPREITHYFVRGRYRTLGRTLAALEEEGAIQRIAVEGFGPRDERYIHTEDLPLLDELDGRAWRPRLSLLPPFDNLVASSARLRQLFGFDYVREQFLPKSKRRFGTYVLPILRGERFLGRIDPVFDRAERRLRLLSVHAELDAPRDVDAVRELAEGIARLAAALGAREVRYPTKLPDGWRRALR
jgi:uncharacterized protein